MTQPDEATRAAVLDAVQRLDVAIESLLDTMVILNDEYDHITELYPSLKVHTIHPGTDILQWMAFRSIIRRWSGERQ